VRWVVDVGKKQKQSKLAPPPAALDSVERWPIARAGMARRAFVPFGLLGPGPAAQRTANLEALSPHGSER
jgi:hypothetical protein